MLKSRAERAAGRRKERRRGVWPTRSTLSRYL
jgi:hypothetical protein